MMYLHFDTQEQAESTLIEAGFKINDYKNHCSKGLIEGTIFKIPISVVIVDEETAIETFEDGIFVNIYDAYIDELKPFEIEAPKTPYNVRA